MWQIFGASLHQKSLRTSRINRCEPRYAGTKFTNRENGHFSVETRDGAPKLLQYMERTIVYTLETIMKLYKTTHF